MSPPTARSSQKVARLAECLDRAGPDEVGLPSPISPASCLRGRSESGWAALRELPPPAGSPTLELLEVHARCRKIATISGAGSQAARRDALADLFGRATVEEQRFLRGLLLGELRQGALEGVMTEAVAKVAAVPAAEIRRAVMVAGELGAVASAVLAEGPDALARFRLTVLRPVQPMLAQTGDDLDERVGAHRPARIEWKLDGARLQVHRLGAEIRAFTRNLADITDRVPEIVEAVGALEVEAIILDGEAIALGPDERPRPFQETMSRFGSRVNVAELRQSVPLSPVLLRLPASGRRGSDRPTRPSPARGAGASAAR